MADWRIVQTGSEGEDVKSAQYLLNGHGSHLTIDGDFGAATKAAVEAFQGAHGLGVDGILGNQTWPALIVEVQSGSAGDAVKAVQSQIDARNQLLLAIDGVFGPATTAAVQGFQGPIGLTVDGIVGPDTWNRLIDGFLGATSGNDANQLVFQAWSHQDQPAALKNATAQAVAQLFAQTWQPNVWTFTGSSGAAGSIFSTWEKTGGELVLRANNSTGAPFFFTTSATF